MGAPRLLFALATAMALLWAARQLPLTPQLGLDALVLEHLQRSIPAPLGQLLVQIYRLTGVQFSARKAAIASTNTAVN